ncbi:hypothetical protein [Paraburkholderia tropica]|uniref:hypothetical protein n=1 Tax=Paraburkholderia tropica TaxID=92647 RepID=UPI002AB18AB2|nr:hypothetical protein [Paraburkholderia tropica]
MTNETTISLTEALSSHGIALTAASANKVLHSAGMIERRARESGKPGRPPKSYWAATQLGEANGIVNEQTDHAHVGDPITAKYLPSKFSALWAHPNVAETLRAMLDQGEIKAKTAAPQEPF